MNIGNPQKGGGSRYKIKDEKGDLFSVIIGHMLVKDSLEILVSVKVICSKICCNWYVHKSVTS